MATEAPGLLVDESKEELGKQLQLPQKYERHRQEIEEVLLRID